MDAVTMVPSPRNETVLAYLVGSPERAALDSELARLAGTPTQLQACIGGRWRPAGGPSFDVRAPHRHELLLGISSSADHDDTREAIGAALAAAPAWREMAFDDRAAILLRAADLLSGPWRARINAATMLGQSKTAVQAEIDSACELADFWRFNVSFARGILAEQPALNSPGVWNRLDHRPLEGFVYAITPFNFTAIAGNLPTAPALMGNVVLWKPSPTQALAAQLTMELLEIAGLPPGVINLLPGDGLAVSDVALASPDLAGLHFTGSTRTFQALWKQIGDSIGSYRSYPRIVGETGGKDFVIAHASADVDVLRTALIRGAFEYQGQKCSAASRAYVPQSVWSRLRDSLVEETREIVVGDVTDPSSFMGAVIDGRSFARNRAALERVAATGNLDLLTGGCDDTDGYFVQPSIVVGSDPLDEIFATEYFGPILAVHVYPDGEFEETLDLIDRTSAYALTGSVIADDRAAAATATNALRFAAGNFYINDKPTGAVVGQQPFGGGRASGTNDKAGAPYNLLRWTSPRTIKETFVPPTDWRYPR